jgi:hypothetical protein
MLYTKPEVVTLARSIEAIQTGGGKGERNVDISPTRDTSCAYEADE